MSKKADEKPSPSWDNHETLDDLVLGRYHLTQKSLAFLDGMSGQVSYEIAKYAHENKINPAKLHEIDAEKKKELRDKIDKVLSFENEIHPLHDYVDAKKIKEDAFLKQLVENIFTPLKSNILNSVGEKDFLEIVKSASQKHRQGLEERASQYIMQDFKVTEENHRKALAKYLGIGEKKGIDAKIAAEPDKYLGQVYNKVISNYRM
jgi:hypothetical protein